MKNSTLVTCKHSGLTRAYFTTIDWRLPLPTLKEVMDNTDDYIDLMYHLALNHKGLNWLIYKQLNADTYKLFIFSLAYCAKEVNPCISFSWQLASNARRVYNKTKKLLNKSEEEFFAIARTFPNWSSDKRSRELYIQDFITNFE